MLYRSVGFVPFAGISRMMDEVIRREGLNDEDDAKPDAEEEMVQVK